MGTPFHKVTQAHDWFQDSPNDHCLCGTETAPAFQYSFPTLFPQQGNTVN